MVLPGQYLERPTLINRRPATDGCAGLTLEGLYHRGTRSPGVVICAPHPRMGGSMDSAVVAELAWALTRAGHPTLRFNYQGVGASGGTLQAPWPGTSPLDEPSLQSERDDARAAARHLVDCVPDGGVALAGYSFGAAVALSVAIANPEWTPLVLVAPPTGLFDFGLVGQVAGPVLIVAGEKDALVDHPSLQALAARHAHVALQTLEGAEHTFTRGLTQLGALVARWFALRATTSMSRL